VSENDVHGIHYDEECVMIQSLLNTGLIFCVRINTIKTKGILVLAPRGIYKGVGSQNIFIIHVVSLSKLARKGFSPPSL